MTGEEGRDLRPIAARIKKVEKKNADAIDQEEARELADSIREKLKGSSRSASLNTRIEETPLKRKLRETPHLTPLTDRLKLK